MYDFVTRFGLLDLLRVLRLFVFLFAGLFVMVDGTMLWPLYILIVVLLPQTTERILKVSIYSKRFGIEDILITLYVFAHFVLFYLLIRTDTLSGVLDAVVAINKNIF